MSILKLTENLENFQWTDYESIGDINNPQTFFGGCLEKPLFGCLRRGGKMPPETFQKLLKNFQKTSEKLSKKLLKSFQKNFGKILQNQFPLLHKRKMKLF